MVCQTCKKEIIETVLFTSVERRCDCTEYVDMAKRMRAEFNKLIEGAGQSFRVPVIGTSVHPKDGIMMRCSGNCTCHKCVCDCVCGTSYEDSCESTCTRCHKK